MEVDKKLTATTVYGFRIKLICFILQYIDRLCIKASNCP